MQQNNNNTSTFKKNEEHGPVGTPDVNATSLDEAWKAVGSTSRRGSLATPAINSSSNFNTTFDNQSPAVSPTPNSLSLPGVRRSSFDQSQWGSLGGFHWEGPGIFDNETRKASFSHSTQVLHHHHHQPPPPPPLEVLVNDASYGPLHQHPFGYNNSILSVPMLPSVSMEPVYRQQRSLSFSVGQDPTFFGYDDYEDASGSGISNNDNSQGAISFGYKNLLATMEEEDQDGDDDDDEDDDDAEDADDDTLQGMINQNTGMAAQWRARSQSSGAAFGLLSPAQHAALLNRQLRRGSEQYEDVNQQRRCSSRFFADIQEPATTIAAVGTANSQSGYPQMSMGEKERLDLLHRRLSQTHGDEYKFPDQSYNILQQRRQTFNQPPPPPHQIQQLSDQFRNTSLRTPDAEYALSRTTSSDTFGLQSGMAHGSYPARQQQRQQQKLQQPQNLLVDRHHEAYFDAEHQQQHHQHQQLASMASTDAFWSSDNKGIPLQRLPLNTTLYSVEFKGGRVDYFYVVSEPGTITGVAGKFGAGDLVIVEGDRGKDLGKVASSALNVSHVEQYLASRNFQQQRQQPQNDGSNSEHDGNGDKSKDVYMKRLYRMATPDEIDLLLEKGQDEMQALSLCQQKVKLRNLPMSVVDAEYQWDRRKLTFFFVSNRRIDFRELVRELFKTYKTRIWMRAVSTITSNTIMSPTPPSTSSDIIHNIES